jgi:hypothetical protein
LGQQGGNWSNPFGSFESLFAFVAAAAANTHKACELVFSDPSAASFVEAGRLYRTAAGYLEYSVNNVVPTLRNRGTTVKYPAEVHTPVLQALMHTCLAQVVTVVRLPLAEDCRSSVLVPLDTGSALCDSQSSQRGKAAWNHCQAGNGCAIAVLGCLALLERLGTARLF